MIDKINQWLAMFKDAGKQWHALIGDNFGAFAAFVLLASFVWTVRLVKGIPGRKDYYGNLEDGIEIAPAVFFFHVLVVGLLVVFMHGLIAFAVAGIILYCVYKIAYFVFSLFAVKEANEIRTDDRQTCADTDQRNDSIQEKTNYFDLDSVSKNKLPKSNGDTVKLRRPNPFKVRGGESDGKS